jgi:hypothetical protein
MPQYEESSRMSTLPSSVYTMLTPTSFLRNWREQRPSNQVTLTRVKVEVGRLLYGDIHTSEFSFVSECVIDFGLLFE